MFGRDKQELEGDTTVTNVPVQVADDTMQTTAPSNPQQDATTSPLVTGPSQDTTTQPETPTPELPAMPEPEMLPGPHTEVINEAPAEEEPAHEESVDTSSDGMEQEMPTETASEPATSTIPGDLGALKLQAMHELSPLIGHLGQSPAEQYETAKMIYEETKDQGMLSAVYEAAKNLPDDKAKAAAIYDVIKKINAL